MSVKWPTKENDLRYAETVIQKHTELNEGRPLSLFEVFLEEDRPIDLRVSDWLLELSEHYQEEYGDDQGEFITCQVISTCITRGQTIH